MSLSTVTALTVTYAAESPFSIVEKDQAGELRLLYNNRTILVYAFAGNQYKPYVKELYTLSGQNILADSPPDHLHHHGLMYAIAVNGTYFWQETPATGIQRPMGPVSRQIGTTRGGLPQASFTHVIYWLDKGGRDSTNPANALLVERRTLTVTVGEQDQEVALQWDARFQVGDAARRVVLSGDNYSGLGMRFHKELDPFSTHSNSRNELDLHTAAYDVSQARWSAVTFSIPSHPISVALFGDPANSRGDAHFFTMVKPFTYLSATQGIDTRPLEYSQGATFNLSYLVTVYPEAKPSDFLHRRAARWKP